MPPALSFHNVMESLVKQNESKMDKPELVPKAVFAQKVMNAQQKPIFRLAISCR